MEYSLPIAALITFAYLLAGFVKGVIGMGLPTVAIAVLAVAVTPAQPADSVATFQLCLFVGLRGLGLQLTLRNLL